ncbi:MAG: hypothetical protein GY804_08775 [Alphaproteobacteria bacterium]|nr:hypothetical protein [Alphaproteobacteria bacterium]
MTNKLNTSIKHEIFDSIDIFEIIKEWNWRSPREYYIVIDEAIYCRLNPHDINVVVIRNNCEDVLLGVLVFIKNESKICLHVDKDTEDSAAKILRQMLIENIVFVLELKNTLTLKF